ncbi:carbonic anhydrase [Novosphingobium beihaiensis]|uniref:carbonic anhydrase n=1 Tax=Novosphingobium beihaiensis TaxID=2930389 RepID=A0ABT0BPE8_9SPHN|nr:carbonic anhydrase family protein [Novosphingobium beihaiensis]MCJ2186955.1 carbonic anhydrase family protein [Novosphingobium beihaiensis]
MTVRVKLAAALGVAVLAPGAFAESGHGPGHETASVQHAAAPVAVHGPHWSYGGSTGGPEHWGDLSPAFSACKSGHMQSPIDLGVAAEIGTFKVRADYRPGALTILNNGHTVQANIPEGSVLSSGIARYKLLQVHFHTPSEATVYGIPYPMVAHFVHVDYAGNYAVLGVLFEEGAVNPELEKLIKAAPRTETGAHEVPHVTFDPARLLPDNLAVFRYEGSLTTPPCTEGVRWHVATHHATASAGQIAALHAIMGDNARPIQPLYGRLLVKGAD